MITRQVKDYIPYYCIAPIVSYDNLDGLEDSFQAAGFTGTGFFVFCPGYENIFFITARHCVVKQDGNVYDRILIPLGDESKKNVRVSQYLMGSSSKNPNDIEDVIVMVVEPRSQSEREYLRKRCLRLQNQDNVEKFIDFIMKNNTNVKILGYPGHSKELDHENRMINCDPRGIYGPISKTFQKNNHLYNVKPKKEIEDPDGFSGSPAIGMIASKTDVDIILLGIVTNGNKNCVNFWNINVVTDIVLNFLSKGNPEQ